ncbi:MAG TPA: hypothetical protein VLB49_03675 [Gemmatimonadales bacterium]|nr:hypothetical protein [Gemmatimonadales bacterium]
MRTLALTAVLQVGWRFLAAQCPDGSPPPCQGARSVSVPRAPDPQVIAVLPFRVAGADSTYGEGVAELIAAEFTGEGGPRSADMGTVIRAWQRAGGSAHTPLSQDAAMRVALQVGAGRLATGSVVALRNRLTLTALVMRVPDGREVARTPPVMGPEDSLPELLRRLSTNLLATAAPRATGERREAATSSPEALRAYMAGRADYRRGRYQQAAAHLVRALDADSSFVLAAFALTQASTWGARVDNLMHFREIAWRGRDHLGARDRALLEAELGQRYPEATPRAERLAAAERAVSVAPDSPEAWYYLGDTHFHWGAFIGIPDARRRARDALERSIAQDSTGGVLSHLLELAILEGDTARARSLLHVFRRLDSGGDLFRQEQWLVAALLRDTVSLHRAHQEADSMSALQLRQVANVLQYAGLALDGEVDTALGRAERQSRTRQERELTVLAAVTAAVNAGRPTRGVAMLDRMEEGTRRDVNLLAFALGGTGIDTALVARAAERVAEFADGPEDPGNRNRYYLAVCTLARWRLEKSDTSHVDHAVTALRAAQRSDVAQTCAGLLPALAEAAGVKRHQGALVRFDSLMRIGSTGSDPYMGIQLGRAYAARGDPISALAAVRRREYLQGLPPYLLAVTLREEGRLAALTGDTTGAVRAYRHYLALRRDPEPRLVPQRDSVRAELARLEAVRK